MNFFNFKQIITKTIKKTSTIKQKIMRLVLSDFVYEELGEWSASCLCLIKAIENKQSESKIIKEATRCYNTITREYTEYFWYHSFCDLMLKIEEDLEKFIISLNVSYSYDPVNCLISMGESKELFVLINYIHQREYEVFYV